MSHVCAFLVAEQFRKKYQSQIFVVTLSDENKVPMPSKKSARKQREKKMDDGEWRAFIVALDQFKKDGTGSHIEDQLLKEFPLFHTARRPQATRTHRRSHRWCDR